MLEARGITTNYAIKTPLDLEIEAGQTVALVGPNGAGKTTLMRSLAGQIGIESGSISIDAYLVHSVDPQRRADLVGFLPQTEVSVSGFSVTEVVSLGCFARRRPFRARMEEEKTRVQDALKSVGLSDLSDRESQTLSGGEYQRVRIARTLAQAPLLMLLDEPLAHLDPGQSHRVAELIARLGDERGVTNLTALHDLNLASLYFDRILLMNNGEVVADGSPEEVIREDLLQSVYQTRFQIIEHPYTARPQVLGLGRNNESC
jgi:iron complex transport system ATP-binding protein